MRRSPLPCSSGVASEQSKLFPNIATKWSSSTDYVERRIIEGQAQMSTSDIPVTPSSRQSGRASIVTLLSRAEWVLLSLVVVLISAGFISSTLSHKTVDWPAFFPAFGASSALVVIGGYIRATRDMPQMALGAIGFGIFMSFTGSVAIFIFTLFPLAHPLIDMTLIDADAALGFSWVGFVNFVGGYPTAGILLHHVYLSILPQVVGVIILLSFLNRAAELHRFLSVGIVCMIATVLFWWLFPSVGPAAYGMVSTDIQQKIHLIANAAYGEDMRTFAKLGVDVITPTKITGVVAFPSFHMVMTCMVLWFTRRTWVFLPLLAVDICMLPATIIHGGHYLVDLFGGLILFVVCLWVVIRLTPDQKTA